MAYKPIKLPSYISLFAKMKNKFNNIVISTKSGREIRSRTSINKITYDLSSCVISQSQFKVFEEFFNYCNGRIHSFIFKDPYLNSLDKVFLCKYDGKIKNYNLIDALSANHLANNNNILQLKKYFILKEHSIKIFTESATAITSYNIENNSVIFNDDTLINTNIYFSCQFYLKARFSNDSFDYEYQDDGSIRLSNLSIILAQN